MKKRVLFVILIGLISAGFLGADVFEFQAFFDGKEGITPHWSRRYLYEFDNGLLTSITTSATAYRTGEIVRQEKVTIKRYTDRVEAYKNENLFLTLYYVDSTTMQLVRASDPADKMPVVLQDGEITWWAFPDIWRIKIIPGEEVIFRINNNGISPWVDFIATGKDPSTVRYDNPDDDIIYEKIAEDEYDRVSYGDGFRDLLARYLVVPNTAPYRIYAVDFLIDYFCGEDFVHLFWGQLITRSQNRLSGLHE